MHKTLNSDHHLQSCMSIVVYSYNFLFTIRSLASTFNMQWNFLLLIQTKYLYRVYSYNSNKYECTIDQELSAYALAIRYVCIHQIAALFWWPPTWTYKLSKIHLRIDQCVFNVKNNAAKFSSRSHLESGFFEQVASTRRIRRRRTTTTTTTVAIFDQFLVQKDY